MWPDGIGWNVETIFWIQTSVIEVAIFVSIYWLVHKFRRIMAREKEIVAFIDRSLAKSPADLELERLRRGTEDEVQV